MAESRPFEDFDKGERYETEGRTVTHSDIRMFVGATGSTDPIHLDEEYVAAHPLVDDVVLQGTLLLGIADGFFVDAIAGDAALAMNFGHDKVRYLDGVSPGDTVHASIEIMDVIRRDEEWGVVIAKVELIDQSEEVVVIDRHRLLVATAANPALDE